MKTGKIILFVNIMILFIFLFSAAMYAQETQSANETQGTPMVSPSPDGDTSPENDDVTPGTEPDKTPGPGDTTPEVTDEIDETATSSPWSQSPGISPNQTTSPIDNVDDDNDQRILWTVIGIALVAAAIIWISYYMRKKR